MAKHKQTEKINSEIRSNEIRLVGENITPGIYTLYEAKKIAEELELDLVEINPNSTPPVARIMDYHKYKYNQKQKYKDSKKKQKASKQSLKEIRFGPNTDDHDFNFKSKNARKFLEKGDLVKAYVFFKGREIIFKDKGELLLFKLADDLSDVGIPISLDLKLEGKKMIMNLKPLKKK